MNENKKENNLGKKLDNLNSVIKSTQFFINIFGHPFGIYGVTPLHICYNHYKKLEKLTSERNRLISKLNYELTGEAI